MQTQAVGLHGHRKTAPLFSTSKNTFFRGTQKVSHLGKAVFLKFTSFPSVFAGFNWLPV
jgi:hypothetical protein